MLKNNKSKECIAFLYFETKMAQFVIIWEIGIGVSNCFYLRSMQRKWS